MFKLVIQKCSFSLQKLFVKGSQTYLLCMLLQFWFMHTMYVQCACSLGVLLTTSKCNISFISAVTAVNICRVFTL